MPRDLTDDEINIGSGNGLVQSVDNEGIKPLPEPMLTQFSVTIMVSLGHNELTLMGSVTISLLQVSRHHFQ